MSQHNDPYIIGSGTRKVIGLNGWFGHSQGWGPLVDQLDRDQFTYAFMDYRGYGSRIGADGPYTLEQISRDVQSLANQLGWHAFALVGHSMGGSAMQYVVADAAERVQCMVGITPVAASGVPFDEKSWALFDAAADDPKARRTILSVLSAGDQPDEWLDTMVASSIERSRPEAVAAYLDAWAKTDFAERIQGKPTPVLVVVGEHDPSITEAVCQKIWMQYYPNAQLKVIKQASHFPMDDTPHELAQAMEGFLSQHMPR